MGDLKTENTSYPAVLDTATLMDDNGSDEIVAAHQNGPNSAILAIETELGLNPAGSLTDLATRLNVNIHADGGLRRGTEFPVGPGMVTHLFYRTDTKRLYVYNMATASYDVVPSSVTLSAYVEKDTANTITAVHTINPAVTGAPFIVGANGQGQLVTGLNADTVDGQHLGATSTPTFNSIVVSSTTRVTNLNADLIDGAHAGTSANNVLQLDANGRALPANLPTIISASTTAAFNTIYQAATDLFVCAWGAGTYITGYMDNTTSPTTVIAQASGTTSSFNVSIAFMCPKGLYWKILPNGMSGRISVFSLGN